jgi:hypothetical protein
MSNIFFKQNHYNLSTILLWAVTSAHKIFSKRNKNRVNKQKNWYLALVYRYMYFIHIVYHNFTQGIINEHKFFNKIITIYQRFFYEQSHRLTKYSVNETKIGWENQKNLIIQISYQAVSQIWIRNLAFFDHQARGIRDPIAQNYFFPHKIRSYFYYIIKYR